MVKTKRWLYGIPYMLKKINQLSRKFATKTKEYVPDYKFRWHLIARRNVSVQNGWYAGLCDYSSKTLYVYINGPALHRTLLHEIAHALTAQECASHGPLFQEKLRELYIKERDFILTDNLYFEKHLRIFYPSWKTTFEAWVSDDEMTVPNDL